MIFFYDDFPYFSYIDVTIIVNQRWKGLFKDCYQLGYPLRQIVLIIEVNSHMGNEQIKNIQISDKEIEGIKKDCDGKTEMKDASQYEEIGYEHIDIQKQMEQIAIKEQDRKDVKEQKKEEQLGKHHQPNQKENIIKDLCNRLGNNAIEKTQQCEIEGQSINEPQKQAVQEVRINSSGLNLDKIENQIFANIFDKNNVQIESSFTPIQLNRQQDVQGTICQQVYKFSQILKSQTIQLDQNLSIASQAKSYWQNKKLILTQPIKSNKAKIVFKVNHLKYCIGAGLALKEIVEKHEFTYKSYQNELSHGLFLITSQGYSWSHIYKSQDDVFRQGFNQMRNNDRISVELQSNQLTFQFKQHIFMLEVPNSIRQKYTLCFCAYLHEKTDSIQIVTIQ